MSISEEEPQSVCQLLSKTTAILNASGSDDQTPVDSRQSGETSSVELVDGASAAKPSEPTPVTTPSPTSAAPNVSRQHKCGSLFAKCRCNELARIDSEVSVGSRSAAAPGVSTKALEIPTTVKQVSRIVAAGHHCTGSSDITSALFPNTRKPTPTPAASRVATSSLPTKRSTSVSAIHYSSYSRLNSSGGNFTAAAQGGAAGKRFSDPDIHKTLGGRLSGIARDLKGLQHPDIPYPITPEVLGRELNQVGGTKGIILGRKGSNCANSESRRHLTRYSKHISIDLDYATPSPGTSPLSSSQRSLNNNLDYHKYNALAYEEQSQIEQPVRPASAQGNHPAAVDPVAHQFLRDFGIFGPMGNGVGHGSSSIRKTSGTTDHQNGNIASITSNALFRRRNSNVAHTTLEYERLKGVVVRLEREFGELESRHGDLQGEIFQCNKELKCKDQEIFRLHREIHKLKSVLQQKTNRSKDEDILSSLQEVHSMANRIPAVQLPNTGNAASKKQGVSAESSDVTGQHKITISKHDKDFRSKQLIKDAIMDNDFLKNLDSLQVREIVDAMYRKEFSAGSYVLREGEAGAHLFVSAEGELEVIKDGKVLGSMGSGKAFGELAILYNCTRTASIRVVLDSKVWVLDRKVFQHIMVRTGLQRLEENINFLRSVPLLKNLNNDVLAKIADVLEIEFYPAGAYIIRQGANGDTFFILSSGSVSVTQKVCNQVDDDSFHPPVETEDEEEIRVLNRGDYFGEQALLKEDCRTASIIALEPGVECLTLDRESFTQLIGDLSELKEKDYGDEHRTLARPTSSNSFSHDLEFDYIHLDDLDVIATLGIGGFGRVELVQYSRDISLTFALKCLKKQHIVDTQQQDHVFSEKLIMMGCRSKFICRLYRTFRDSKYVYMLLEACLGGEVWTVLRDRGSFDDRTTTFVTACVVAAFEYLHGKGIVYRDLKPENLLMDSKGYVKLVDFGFAKRLPRGSKTWTFCGTPEYVAPETILNRGHDRAVDYWALGVLMHELLSGNPPFTAPDPMTTYNLILKGIVMIDFSRFNISRSAQSLIKKLCRDSPSERLGYQRGGIQDIKKHKWFQGFDWDGLNNGSIQAPIIKGVRGPCDTSNFDCYTKDSDIPPDEVSNWDIDF